MKPGKTILVKLTGNAFFSTDATPVLRTLQIGAPELWKEMKADGVCPADPLTGKAAQQIKRPTYKQALLNDELNDEHHIMDAATFALAEIHNLVIRIINIYTDNVLIQSAQDTTFGSTVRAH